MSGDSLLLNSDVETHLPFIKGLHVWVVSGVAIDALDVGVSVYHLNLVTTKQYTLINKFRSGYFTKHKIVRKALSKNAHRLRTLEVLQLPWAVGSLAKWSETVRCPLF